MADPIVHLTNGIPDSGTGNVTTLGQTLLDGANIVLGATSDAAITAGAAGSINAHLRSISRDIVGGVVIQAGANVIGAVTQSGGPWSVSGTIAATQSGTWNINNISGAISLPTGAATAANQPTNAALGSVTSGQTGHLGLGAVTTAAPSYTTGQSNALSLTTAGALRTDSSATTQPVSGTVSISGTIPVSQSGTWTVQPGNTPNTTPWLFTLSQGGNAATVSAAGALKVDGSAVTQPISAAALPLPSGAATAANQPSNAAQGSTTSGQTGGLSQGAVTTSAPTYVNGTTNPLSLTTAGAIRVDASATTQPVSGTVAATQSGVWSSRLQDGSGNSITSDARGSARPLAVEILDASGNQITSFGAGSGPSFGSAVPSTGTAVGFNDGVNLQMGRVFDLDTGAGTEYDLGVILRKPAAGGSVVFGTSTDPIRVDPTGTTTQPVSLTSTTITGTVAVTQSGTWNVNNISGTVSLPTGAATSANQPTNAALGSTTSGQTGTLSLGAVTTAAPSYATGQSNALSLTTAGLLRTDGSGVTQPISGSVSITGSVAATQSGTWNITNVSGTISLPTGAATAALQPTNATLGSTTSGQSGTLGLGAVTSAAPSYTTATSNALSLTTAGALRTDASATTQPISGTVTASQGGTWTVQPGNTANTTPWLFSINQGGNTAAVTASSALKVDNSAVTQPVSGTVTANQGGNWTSRIVGNAGAIMDLAGQNAAAPANSLLVAGEFNTSPTTISSGNASPLQLDNAGNLKVNVVAGGAAGGGTSSSYGSAFPASGTAAGFSDGTNMQGARVFDGDTGAGTQYLLGTLLKKPASGGTVDFGTSTDPIRIDPTGTTTQPVSGTVSISGTVAATQSGTWNITNISGTVSLPTGAATSANQPTAATLGSTTSGQTGGLSLGAVTTAAPTYTTAQTNALSLTTAGALRVDGSGVTQPVSGTFWQATQPVSGTVTANQGGTWTVQPGNTANTTPWLVTAASATAPVSTMNSASAASGLNSAMAAVFDDVTPTAITENNFGFVRMSANRNQYMTIRDAAGNERGVNVSAGNALLVDASATTQPVSGTVTANQGGTWNITNVSGTVSLPTGAATSANQPTNSSQGASTSGQTGTLAMGAVTTGNPTYTTAQTSPLSLDTSGALRVNVIAGSGGGGTSSSFGSAFPATGTAIGVKDSAGTNMTFLQVNASNALKVDGSAVTQPVSGTVTANQGGAPWSMKPDGTTWGMSGTSANVNLTNASVAVTGTFWQATQPISAASLPLPSGAATSANQPSNAAIGSTTSGQTGGLAFGAVTTAAPSYTTAQSNPLSLTTAGALRVDGSAVTQPVSGTVSVSGTVAVSQSGTWTVQPGNTQNTTAWLVTGTGGTFPITAASLPLPSGASTAANQTNVQGVIGNATSPASMIVTGGVFNTTKPTLTTGQSAAIQVNSSGIQLVDGSSVTQPVSGTFWQATQPVSIAAAVTVQQSTAANLLCTASQGGTWNINNVSGTISLPTGASTSANQPSNAGQGSTTSGQTGTLAMGAVTTGNPTYTTAQTSPLSLDTSGALRVNVIAGSGGGGTSSSYGSAFPATGTAIGVKDSAGTNMTFLQVNASNALKVDGSAVTQPVSGTFWQATQPVSIAAAVTVAQSTAGNLLCTASQGGTWTVQPGNTANTTPWLASINQGGNSAVVKAASTAAVAGDPALVVQISPNTPAVTVQGSLQIWNSIPFVSGTSWTSATGLNSVNAIGSTNPTVNTILGQFTQGTTITAGAATFEESFDNGTTWLSVPAGRLINPATGAQLANPYTFVASTNQPWQVVSSGTSQVRIRLSTAITGTGTVAMGCYQVQGVNDIQVFQNNAANLKVDISGTAANATAINVAQATSSNLKAQVDPLTATSWGIYGQGSTTSGQSGPLVMGAVSSSSPSYTNGQTSPLSLQTNGNLRVAGVVAGDTQPGTADSGWPVKIGGVATTGIPTNVTNGQRVDASFDKTGRQLVVGAVRGMKNRSVVSLTTGSAVSIIGAGGAGVYSDVYGVIATNKSATAVTIVFNDGSSTSFTLAVPAGDTRGFMLPVDSAINQVTANAAWTATMSSAVTSVELTTLYVLNN